MIVGAPTPEHLRWPFARWLSMLLRTSLIAQADEGLPVPHQPARRLCASSPSVLLNRVVRSVLLSWCCGGCVTSDPPTSDATLRSEDAAVGLPIAALGLLSSVLGPSTEVGSSTSCQIIVLAADECSYCHQLSVGWGRDMKAVVDSVGGILMRSSWIVAQQVGRRGLRESLGGQGIAVVARGANLTEVQRISGLRGTPITLLVDRTDTVRVSRGGNVLIASGELREWCTAE